MPVPAFAVAVLFRPLGIRSARWASWNGGSDTDTGGHLVMPTHEMLRLGRMVLAEGEWRGRRVVGRDWIQAMTAPHTGIPNRTERYGFFPSCCTRRNRVLP